MQNVVAPQRRTDAPEAAPAGPGETPTTQAAARTHDPVFESALAGVHAMDRGMGRTPDEASERVAAALAAEWRAHGHRDRIDGVVLGGTGAQAAAGECVRGSADPVEQSLARADEAVRAQTLQTLLADARSQPPGQDAPGIRMC